MKWRKMCIFVFVMRRLLVIVSVWLLGFGTLACSAEKRAIKKLDRAVQLTTPEFAVSYLLIHYNLTDLSDTVIVNRTTISYDSVLVFRQDTVNLVKQDTIYVNKDKLKLQLIRVRDTIRVRADCISDTVFREKIVTIYKPHNTPPESKVNWWKYLCIAALVLWAITAAKRFIKDNL